MDNKRVILAVALSFLVLLGWNYLFPPAPPVVQSHNEGTAPNAVEPESGSSLRSPESAGSSAAQAVDMKLVLADGSELSVTTPLYTATLNSKGGLLTHFKLARYKETVDEDSPAKDLVTPAALSKTPLGILVNGEPSWAEADWSVTGDDLNLAAGQSGSLVLKGVMGEMTIVRELRFSADSYLIEETTSVTNTGAGATNVRLGYTLASTLLSAEGNQYDVTRVAYYDAEGLTEEKDTDDLTKGLLVEGGADWGGVQSNYFLLALVGDGAAGAGSLPSFRATYGDSVYRVGFSRTLETLAAGETRTSAAAYYVGPKKTEALAAADPKLSTAIDLGWFDFIAKPLLIALNVFEHYVGNYGVAIILLTIVIKIVFWPLSQKSYKSMESMKKLQPHMAKLREKYGDDRERLNKEMMDLYKTYKVNPMGGCLPMVLQIPVFIGLYQALLNSIELRHAPFITHVPFTDIVWLADLSAMDPFYVTPLIMGATMFLQQKMTPAPGDPTQAKVMMFMPVIFTFIFLNFPAGLVIYWLVNNVLSIAQQYMMLRKA